MERRIMQNLERSEFEEQWKDAFAGAEVAPSASVWANVDRGLTLADNKESKKRIIFYQRLAAASVLFAVIAGTFGVYYWRQNETSIVQLNPGKTTDVASQVNPKATENNSSSQTQTLSVDSSAQLNSLTGEKNGSTQNQAAIATNALAKSKSIQLSSGKTSESTAQKSVGKSESSAQKQIADSSTKRSATQLNSRKDVALQTQSAVPDSSLDNETEKTSDRLSLKAFGEKTSVAAENNSISNGNAPRERSEVSRLAATVALPGLQVLPTAEIQGEPKLTEIYRKLPYIPAAFMNESKERKFEHEKLWASVTAASGAYTESVGSSYNSMAAMKMYSTAVQQSGLSNGAYNSPGIGLVPTVGKSYSYGVIGGVRLTERWVLQTGVQYMNQTMGSPASQYANYGSSGLISTNEFVSVPVQAGYLLVNKKIGWQLNPGVSTDFFVRNTLSNQQQSVSQGAGENSPYRAVNFAGLMSSEFSYKLGKNYRLSLVPGMRYSFNPALKSAATGSAIAWDVGFRFRYIFK
jgi:hypothetical protein